MSACPGWERLSASSEWTDDERRHVETCARCASFVAEYRTFLSGDAQLPAADRSDADQRLGAFISRQLDAEAVVPRPQPARERTGLLDRLAAWFASPPARWATSVAALVIVTGVVFMTRPPAPRVGDTQRGVVAGEFAVSASPAEGGAVHLAWEIAANADGYRVEVLSADLRVVRSFDATGAQEWQFDAASTPEGAFVRVVAMRMGDRLTETAPVPLPGR